MDHQSVDQKRLIITVSFFLILCVVIVLIGRRQVIQDQAVEQDKYSVTGFAFDTTYTITLYQGGSQKLLDACTKKCAEYERIFSRTQENSELYQINTLSKLYAQGDMDRLDQLEAEGKLPEYQVRSDGGLEVMVSESLAEIISEGLRYGEISAGSFDITIEPVSSLWDFTAEEPMVPKDSDIQSALSYVDYSKVSLQGQRLILKQPGIGLDLGGIAKGYIADQLKEYLTGQGVMSGTVNLGGNVLCIGEKSDGSDFRIGVQCPFADRNETIITVAVKDVSVVSSGIYERCFIQNDKIYHHILDPVTGYPRENDLMAVTIISEASVDGDGLSTTCFGLGLEDGMKLINSLKGITAVFITKDEKLHYADGFEELLIS